MTPHELRIMATILSLALAGETPLTESELIDLMLSFGSGTPDIVTETTIETFLYTRLVDLLAEE